MLRLALRSALVVVASVVFFVGLAALGNARVDAPTAFATSRLRALAPPPLAAPVELRVVTFNIADGYGFTNNRSERMRAIAKAGACAGHTPNRSAQQIVQDLRTPFDRKFGGSSAP